jgi:hypothetical protein
MYDNHTLTGAVKVEGLGGRKTVVYSMKNGSENGAIIKQHNPGKEPDSLGLLKLKMPVPIHSSYAHPMVYVENKHLPSATSQPKFAATASGNLDIKGNHATHVYLRQQLLFTFGEDVSDDLPARCRAPTGNGTTSIGLKAEGCLPVFGEICGRGWYSPVTGEFCLHLETQYAPVPTSASCATAPGGSPPAGARGDMAHVLGIPSSSSSPHPTLKTSLREKEEEVDNNDDDNDDDDNVMSGETDYCGYENSANESDEENTLCHPKKRKGSERSKQAHKRRCLDGGRNMPSTAAPAPTQAAAAAAPAPTQAAAAAAPAPTQAAAAVAPALPAAGLLLLAMAALAPAVLIPLTAPTGAIGPARVPPPPRGRAPAAVSLPVPIPVLAAVSAPVPAPVAPVPAPVAPVPAPVAPVPAPVAPVPAPAAPELQCTIRLTMQGGTGVAAPTMMTMAAVAAAAVPVLAQAAPVPAPASNGQDDDTEVEDLEVYM